MEFRVLGPLEVVRDGVAIDLGGAKQRAVLAALLTRAGRVVSSDRLSDDVWDGSPPPSADTTLRAYISNLRKALRPDDVLHTKAQGYVLDVESKSIDAQLFESLSSDGREALASGDHGHVVSILSAATALWRGRAYEEFADTSFAQAESSRLEELKLNCVEDLFEARLALGQHADLTAELEALTTAYPLRERLRGVRMLALYRSGRAGDALHTYEEARSVLAEELGADPSPELRRLHESILRHDDELASSGTPARGKQTLSFVFTDVELSTEMLIGAPDEFAYAKMMEDHRDALRAAVSSHGGQRMRTWGDAFFAAFDTATDAVRAALSAQLALNDDLTEGVRVRMGVHSGDAAVVTDDYVGLAVHAAARVQSAAHGGQILITHSTKELLDALEDVSFLDLGPHRLKDIPEPMRLFQLVHPKLPKSFPRPRTMSAMPHNLPAQATSFVGREDDVRAAAEALERARVVTLTGVGGVGKTRLAQEVGAEVLPRYPDGVWLCELAPIGEPDAIVHTIARELHVSQQQDLSARDSLMAFLRQQRTLLILDNCEHLLEPVADLVEDVVRNCPSLTVLATSREGIGVEGEHIRPVRSLSTPADDDCESIEDAESVRLFLERARAVRPDFELSPHNAQAVTEICRRLDGIALAIELAAARLTSMGPLEIAARLDRRFRFLRSGRRTAVERHRTLQAAADWSYALLGPDEQRLFERVSVFAGGFRLDAAERVCGDEMDADLAELIEGLVAKSLLNADTSGDDTRYFMLETLRQYAADKLAERGDAEAVRDAHLSWVRDLVAAVEREAFGSGDIDWIRVAEREIDNLLAGYEWAITTDNADAALEMIVGLRWSAAFGRTRELNDSWALRALGLPGADTHPLAPVVYGLVSGAAWYRGAREASREYAERALSLAPDPDDARRAEAMFSISIVSVLEGKADEGLAAIDEALRLTRLGDDPALEDNVALVRAMFISYTGDLERAQAYLDEAKPLKTSATPMRALERYVTGEVLLDADPPTAIAALEEAVELSRLMGHEFLLNVARLSEVSLRGRHFDVHEALAAYPEMIESWRRAGNWTQQWTTLRNLLEHFARIERDEAAVVLYFAAASAPTAGPLVWAQGERLGNLISELEARKGAEAFLAARKRGTNMTGEQAVAFALAEIDAALARREEPTAVP